MGAAAGTLHRAPGQGCPLQGQRPSFAARCWVPDPVAAAWHALSKSLPLVLTGQVGEWEAPDRF